MDRRCVAAKKENEQTFTRVLLLFWEASLKFGDSYG